MGVALFGPYGMAANISYINYHKEHRGVVNFKVVLPGRAAADRAHPAPVAPVLN